MEKSRKQNRKRRLETKTDTTNSEINAPKAKFREWTQESQAEEDQLNRILFGASSEFLKSLEEAEREPLRSSSSTVDSGVGEDDIDDAEMEEPTSPAPAWHDDDDDGIEVGHALSAQNRKLPKGMSARYSKYSALLENKFTSINATPNWAVLEPPKTSDEDDLVQKYGYIAKGEGQLSQGILDFKKVRDLNSETYNEGDYVNAVEFHPTSSVALVAGYNGRVTLFACDGARNNKIHSMQFEHFPIFNACFSHHGNEVVFGSRHSHIFNYDLISAKPRRVPLPPGITQAKKFILSSDFNVMAIAGKYGEVHLVTARSFEKISTLKQESEVTALSFNKKCNLLFGHSDTGEVTVWDVNMRKVLHKFVDEGCLQGTTLSVASSGQFLAAGSAQGIVNLYDMEEVMVKKRPLPRKTISNLTTRISDLKFNESSEILAVNSIDVKNAVKLVHVGSGTVFSNFPCFGAKLGNVNVLNFSPGSGFLALGNNASVVPLFRLKHFKHY